MDLKQLQYFSCVAEKGSFSKAAIALHLAQPSLSRQVQLLEQELGQKLLERTGRGVSLTPAGTALLGHARLMLNQAEQALYELKELGQDPTGTIVVGIPSRLALVTAVPLIRAFRERLPQARLSIVEGLTPDLRENLINGAADVSLLFAPRPTPLLSYELLHEDVLVLVAPQRTALKPQLAFAELSDYAFVLPSSSKPIRQLVDHAMAAQPSPLRIIAEVSAVQTALRVVEEGLACTIVPQSALALRNPTRAVAIATLVEPVVTNALVLAMPKAKPISRLMRETCQLLRQCMQNVYV